MVRQVAGRALRGRGAYDELPAIVHMPADPQLVEYAERIDVLGGVSLEKRTLQPRAAPTEPDGGGGGRFSRECHALDAQPSRRAARVIAPPMPNGSVAAAPEPIEISTPELPAAPEDLAAAQRARDGMRAELHRLLSVYSQLRRSINPAYQLASAHGELAAAGFASTDAQTPPTTCSPKRCSGSALRSPLSPRVTPSTSSAWPAPDVDWPPHEPARHASALSVR